jgi:imidazolonepropionase-like amidohydrolase
VRILPALFAAAVIIGAVAPPEAAVESGTLRLHYVQKPIGYERYSIDRDDSSLQLTSDFDFTDRGGRVQLAATLRTQTDLTPLHFTAKGKTYRFVNVDSEIVVDGSHARIRADGRETSTAVPRVFFTVDGYAPFSAQMLMLRYWLQHGKPRVLPTLPGLSGGQPNEVIIEAHGRDTMKAGAKSVAVSRYSVDGVVWGRETLWLDDRGSMAAAITRAGGLSFEAVRDDLESALVDFVTSGTRDRIGNLEAITHGLRPLHAGAFALVGGTVIDATGRPPIPDATVVVRDGRIVDVGRSRDVTIPPGVPVVRVDGRTIVPGLWDMHTHVTQVEWAPVYLAAGVTTVRDMGNEFEFITALRSAVDAKRALGPRLLLAGLIDGGGPNSFGVYDAASPEEAARLVVKYHDAGFQQIKVYSLLTAPVVAAICSEAHRLGMTVTGHVPNGMTIEQAVNAGMDHIAHLPIRGEAGTPDVDLTVAFLKSHHTVLDPTQSWGELLGHAAGTPIDAFQPGVDRIPPPLNRLFSNAGTAGIDAAAARARVERGLRIVRELHDAGVPVVVGTDEGIPGHSVHREIELYVEAGFTPMEALQAATIVSARAMKLDGELGTIEKGKRADLVVLDANPLDRIQNIRSVRWTISDGRVYDAATLWSSVRFKP